MLHIILPKIIRGLYSVSVFSWMIHFTFSQLSFFVAALLHQVNWLAIQFLSLAIGSRWAFDYSITLKKLIFFTMFCIVEWQLILIHKLVTRKWLSPQTREYIDWRWLLSCSHSVMRLGVLTHPLSTRVTSPLSPLFLARLARYNYLYYRTSTLSPSLGLTLSSPLN